MKRMTSLLLVLIMLVALAATPTLAQEIRNNDWRPLAVEQLSKDLASEIAAETKGAMEEMAPISETVELTASITQNANDDAPLLKFEDIRNRVVSYNPTAKQLSAQEDELNELDPEAMAAGLTQMESLNTTMSGLLVQVQTAMGRLDPTDPANADLVTIYSSLAALLNANKASISSQITSMESQIATLKSSQETGANSINDGINQLVKGVESLYVGIVTIEAALDDIQRGIDTLDRAVAILEKQYELGMASAYDVESIKYQRSSVASQLESLKFQMTTTKITLENMCGYELKGTIRLGALTMPTEEELAAVDYEKTVSAARDRNVSVQNAFYEWWNDTGSESKELTMMAAEADFDAAYKLICMTVAEKQRLLAVAQEKVDFQKRTFEIEAKKYELGMISHEEYMTADGNLKQAQSDYFTAQLELFTAYRNYFWGKNYGIV